jgi:hypothetical protein
MNDLCLLSSSSITAAWFAFTTTQIALNSNERSDVLAVLPHRFVEPPRDLLNIHRQPIQAQ